MGYMKQRLEAAIGGVGVGKGMGFEAHVVKSCRSLPSEQDEKGTSDEKPKHLDTVHDMNNKLIAFRLEIKAANPTTIDSVEEK